MKEEEGGKQVRVHGPRTHMCMFIAWELEKFGLVKRFKRGLNKKV